MYAVDDFMHGSVHTRVTSAGLPCSTISAHTTTIPFSTRTQGIFHHATAVHHRQSGQQPRPGDFAHRPGADRP